MLSLLLSLPMALQGAPPAFTEPEVAATAGSTIRLLGSDFGNGTQSGLLYISGGHSRWLAATNPAILSWRSDRIQLSLPPAWVSGQLWVATPDGLSSALTLELYQYDSFPIPPTPGTNASPLAIAVDGQSRVWVNEEFHLAFQRLEVATGVVTGLAPPLPPPPGPFATTIFSDHQTQMSTLGEDVLVDPYGRIWFSEGGASLYDGLYPNHSRLVCLLPDAPGGPEFRVYNLPHDNNQVVGLTWDPVRDWLWFAEGSLAAGSNIVGFDPDLLPWDNHFDFQSSLDHLAAYPGLESDAVYHYFPVPEAVAHAAHLLINGQGEIWFTQFWGRAISRLRPFSGGFTTYPVPAAISRSIPSFIVGAGPWALVEAPNGDIIFNEFFDATITRFDISRADDPLSQQLDAQGRNPAMTDWVLPFYDRRKETMHSIAYDAQGRLWYTIHTDDEPDLNAAVGYLAADGSFMTRFPPIDRNPALRAYTADGIAIDPASGDIFLAEYWRKRIGRLHYLPPLP